MSVCLNGNQQHSCYAGASKASEQRQHGCNGLCCFAAIFMQCHVNAILVHILEKLHIELHQVTNAVGRCMTLQLSKQNAA